MSHGSHVAFPILNVSLSLCVRVEPGKGQLIAEQRPDSGSHLCISLMYPHSYSIGPSSLKDVP